MEAICCGGGERGCPARRVETSRRVLVGYEALVKPRSERAGETRQRQLASKGILARLEVAVKSRCTREAGPDGICGETSCEALIMSGGQTSVAGL